ncbi:MAG: hypothetical protein SGCHY_000097 [Lobulomycetales sp.]
MYKSSPKKAAKNDAWATSDEDLPSKLSGKKSSAETEAAKRAKRPENVRSKGVHSPTGKSSVASSTRTSQDVISPTALASGKQTRAILAALIKNPSRTSSSGSFDSTSSGNINSKTSSSSFQLVVEDYNHVKQRSRSRASSVTARNRLSLHMPREASVNNSLASSLSASVDRVEFSGEMKRESHEKTGRSLAEPDPSHDWSEDPELISQVKRQIKEREQLKQAKKLEKEQRQAAKELERSSRQSSAMTLHRNIMGSGVTRKVSQGSLSPSFRSNSAAESVSTVETDKDSAVEMKGLVDSYFRLSVVDVDSDKALSATSISQFPHSIESRKSESVSFEASAASAANLPSKLSGKKSSAETEAAKWATRPKSDIMVRTKGVQSPARKSSVASSTQNSQDMISPTALASGKQTRAILAALLKNPSRTSSSGSFNSTSSGNINSKTSSSSFHLVVEDYSHVKQRSRSRTSSVTAPNRPSSHMPREASGDNSLASTVSASVDRVEFSGEIKMKRESQLNK